MARGRIKESLCLIPACGLCSACENLTTSDRRFFSPLAFEHYFMTGNSRVCISSSKMFIHALIIENPKIWSIDNTPLISWSQLLQLVILLITHKSLLFIISPIFRHINRTWYLKSSMLSALNSYTLASSSSVIIKCVELTNLYYCDPFLLICYLKWWYILVYRTIRLLSTDNNNMLQ